MQTSTAKKIDQGGFQAWSSCFLLQVKEDIPVIPDDVRESTERATDARPVLDPLPKPKNTTTKKLTPITEKSSHATEGEEETLESLEELQVAALSLPCNARAVCM